jgi:DNA-binding SARP family transcriptional activator
MDTAAAKLHKAAHYARKVTGHPGTIVLGGDMVQLFPDTELSVDVLEFEQTATAAVAAVDTERAAQAARLYRGDLLPDDLYEDWAAGARDRLRQLYVAVLTLLERWQDVVTVDPGDERAHLELMRQFVAAGDRYGALRQYDRLDRTLRAELGVQPSREAVQLRDRLLHQETVEPSEEEQLVGRAGELATLGRVLDGTTRRGARTVLLSGEAGIGKTALLRRMTDDAAARGWRVGVGVGASIEGAWAYAPLLDAVADLCRRQPALLDGVADRYRQEIDRVLAGVDAPWTGTNTHQRLFVAVAELLRLAAATTGAVLAIDDVQDADEATLRMLHYLPRALTETNVVLVLACRTDLSPPASLEQLRTSLIGRHGGIELELAPLGSEAIDQLVARHAPGAPANQRERIATLSRGNPYMAIELADRSGGPSWAADLDVLAVAGIPPSTRELLQRVAVAGSMFDIDEFVALSGLPD